MNTSMSSVFASFISIRHKIESFGKRFSQLRKMLLTNRPVGAIFLVTDMGGTKPLWVVLLLAGDPGVCEKAG